MLEIIYFKTSIGTYLNAFWKIPCAAINRNIFTKFAFWKASWVWIKKTHMQNFSHLQFLKINVIWFVLQEISKRLQKVHTYVGLVRIFLSCTFSDFRLGARYICTHSCLGHVLMKKKCANSKARQSVSR